MAVYVFFYVVFAPKSNLWHRGLAIFYYFVLYDVFKHITGVCEHKLPTELIVYACESILDAVYQVFGAVPDADWASCPGYHVPSARLGLA